MLKNEVCFLWVWCYYMMVIVYGDIFLVIEVVFFLEDVKLLVILEIDVVEFIFDELNDIIKDGVLDVSLK